MTILVYDNSAQRQVYASLSEKNVILLSHNLIFQTNENWVWILELSVNLRIECESWILEIGYF